ncbi:GH92 family glycosyl hydrolase, partial [Rarobacter incanus]
MLHTPNQPRKFARRPHRIAAAALTCAGALVLAPLVSAPAALAAATWSTSFESGDPQPVASNNAGSANVGSTYLAGSLAQSVSGIAATSENSPSETAAKLVDGDAATKWLAFAQPSTSSPLEITVTLSSAKVVKKYQLISGGDAAERDPKAWKLMARAGSGSWQELSDKSGQTFESRGAAKVYDVTNTTAYDQYKLVIRENAGGTITQLADLDLSDGSSTQVGGGMTITAGGGPTSGSNIKSGAGWTGMKALKYAGTISASGSANAASVLFDNLNIAVGSDTELAYMILPQMNSNDSRYSASDDSSKKYPATYAALDVEFTDGTRASSLNLTDQYGYGFTARGQGVGKVLYGNQWNSVRVSLGAGAAGKTVKKILMTYENPVGVRATSFSGYVDDIKVRQAQPINSSSLTNYVDTRRGSNSSGSFSRGNNIPATAMPNGFNFVTPVTRADQDSWIHNWQGNNDDDNKSRLQAIMISHETSPWMGDRAQIAVMPDKDGGRPSGDLNARSMSFSRDNEVAQPDYYKVAFDSKITTEVTMTNHGGIYRFTNDNDESGIRVVLDRTFSGEQGQLNIDASGNVTGWVEGGSGLSTGNSRMFISGKFSKNPTARDSASDRAGSAYGRFAISGSDRTVELRWATSFISQDQAAKNLAREVTGKSFDQIRNLAKAAWNERLGVIDLTGSNATDVEKVNIYSDLYRLNIYPNILHEDVSALGSATPEWKYASPLAQKSGNATATSTNAQVKSGKMYVNNGFWDTYRTAWPLYAFLYPDLSEELVDGFVQQYRDSGWISRWSSPGYADLMTGTSSDAAFAEAYTSGAISTKLAEEAYTAGVKNATVVPSGNTPAGTGSNQVGRKSIDNSQFLGYTPVLQPESVSWGLEGYINDYALGKMAQKLSQDTSLSAAKRKRYTGEAQYFLTRSEDYSNIFDSSIGGNSKGFFQGKYVDGSWVYKAGQYSDSTARSEGIYNPEDWDLGKDYNYNGNHLYTETDGWNFAFHAPFDVDGLAALYGGKQGLVNKLKTFYSTPERAWSRSIHETFEARDVRMGQFGMSNQVSHHIPYISAAAGDPTTTQEVVSEVMQRLFVGSEIGQGYPGDEDNGEMSSWYIFSAMGFYPLALGSGNYTIGTPLLDKMVIKRTPARGGDLTITAPGKTWAKKYVSGVSLTTGGSTKQLTTTSLSQSDLRAASALNFTVSETASSWGSQDLDADSPQVHRDVLGGSTGTTSVTSGTNTGSLYDNSSLSDGSFGSATGNITWTANSGTVTVDSYTITSGTDKNNGSPKSWQFQGFDADTGWKTLDSHQNESFDWNRQTRPFAISDPGDYSAYRLLITGTNSGNVSMAEVEFLVSGVPVGDTLGVSATDQSGVRAGQPLSATVGAVSGVTSTAGLTASVDYGDGTAQRTLGLESDGLTGVRMRANHTYSLPGTYTMTVKVTKGGSTVTDTATVTVVRDAALTAYFNSACTTTLGTAADCDGNGYAFDRTQLAASGWTSGATVKHPSDSSVKLVVPSTSAGEPDNVVALGQTIALNLGSGATKLAVYGTANEGAHSGKARIHYANGESTEFDLSFGDWVGGVSSGTVVGSSNRRLLNAGTGDDLKVGIFASQVISLKSGTTPISITLPAIATGISKGQIHVFGIASDGTTSSVPALIFTAGSSVSGVAGTETEYVLGTAAGGAGAGQYSASIAWGDGGPVTLATVRDGKIVGKHTYAKAGTYNVVVTLDDGQQSVSGAVGVTATEPSGGGDGGNTGGGDGGNTGGGDGGNTGGGNTGGGDGGNTGGGNTGGGDGGNTGGGNTGGGDGGNTGGSDGTGTDPTTVRVWAPTASKASQPYGAIAKRRVTVSAVVAGMTQGTVTFKSGAKVLATAKIRRQG